MGDMGDIFRDMAEESKRRRASNRESSPKVLDAHGVRYTSHNNGAHLVVEHKSGCMADFWPGTGKWILRGSGEKGRGVFNLIKALRGEK